MASIHVFIEYKVKLSSKKLYEVKMKDVLENLPDYEVEDIEWFEAADQEGLYVEMFKVPTMSHYYALKERRKSPSHAIFGQLDQVVDGGVEKLHCWAFVAKI
ncbi:hypothetical protein [Texcoconibacillus texcoconensis]|uniref:Uncharacterized protein n=1 Tax=Texcoconibacillus texcoconensis TaxID=1095777 RepID=A0A840QTK2_9BACI|nr:hypothetical protein [Texcoconibacillus texcoconensis]MBB5174629.1 hypothetical protein [Texcoconibacillus texcoconensis]